MAHFRHPLLVFVFVFGFGFVYVFVWWRCLLVRVCACVRVCVEVVGVFGTIRVVAIWIVRVRRGLAL